MDWNENEHSVLVFMKMSVLKTKTGSINSGTVVESGRSVGGASRKAGKGQQEEVSEESGSEMGDLWGGRRSRRGKGKGRRGKVEEQRNGEGAAGGGVGEGVGGGSRRRSSRSSEGEVSSWRSRRGRVGEY